MNESDLAVEALVVNRVHPAFPVTGPFPTVPVGSALAALVDNLHDYQAVNEREESAYAELVAQVAPSPVARVPLARRRRPRRERAGPRGRPCLRLPAGGAGVPGSRVSLTAVHTILVASDAPSVRAEVIAVVGEPDVGVIEVTYRPRRGPAAVAEHEPDLLVVDLQMGNMGGMAVCLELRLEESYGNLPARARPDAPRPAGRRLPGPALGRRGLAGEAARPASGSAGPAEALLDGGTYHDESFQPVPLRVAGAVEP